MGGGIKVERNKKYRTTEAHLEVVPIHVARTAGNQWVWITPRRPAVAGSALLHIRANYQTDGPSGPTWDSPCAITGSVVHDALYQLMREGHISREHRGTADRMLRDLCIGDGMPRWRAWIWYAGVRLFGWWFCRRSR